MNVLTLIKDLIESLDRYVALTEEADLSFKTEVNKWSKKEIVGHLIDSAINNLQRFTEIPSSTELYHVQTYSQDELVRVNQYQVADITELIQLLKALNQRIILVIKSLNSTSLDKPIMIGEKKLDLRFLIEDYAEHLQHHVTQIII